TTNSDDLSDAHAVEQREGASASICVVTFNRRSTSLSTPEQGDAALAGALARQPQLAYGTHIYDAVGTAMDKLAGTDLSSGSVVLLSDGADTGSRLTEQTLIKRARSQHVRVF